MTDRDRLAAALRCLTSTVRKSSDRAWLRKPAVRVIDCVLSLHQSYDRFVVPRLDRFEQDHPSVHSVTDLRALMEPYPSPHQFLAEALNYQYEARAVMLNDVVCWLVENVSGYGPYEMQLYNLQRWATDARPDDHGKLHIRGFGLAGFQYLRMLFGANTSKPDIHIRRYVASVVRHSVSDVGALRLLEDAASETGIRLRDLDTTIWESSARARPGAGPLVDTVTDTSTLGGAEIPQARAGPLSADEIEKKEGQEERKAFGARGRALMIAHLQGMGLAAKQTEQRNEILLRGASGKSYRMLIRTVRWPNYPFYRADRFRPSDDLLAGLVVFRGNVAEFFIFPSTAWESPPLLKYRAYRDLKSKPEYGINFSERNRSLLNGYSTAQIAPLL
jgi:hypothetical protein